MSSRTTRGRERPVLIFDGDCGVCRRSILHYRAIAGDRVECVPYQEYDFPPDDPELNAARCERAVHLVAPDGTVTRGAEACFEAVGHAPGKGWFAYLYGLPGVARITEWGYRLVADHRPGVSKVVGLVAGPDPTPSSYLFGRRLFLALLGIAFLVAFWSFGVQAEGLIGPDGVLPLGRMVAWESFQMPHALLAMPTVFWFDQSGGFLSAVIWIGAFAGGLLALGVWPRLMLFVAAVCWLSLSTLAFPPGAMFIGNEFLGYQWDALLVEAGLLGLFVAPRGGLRPRWQERPSAAGIFLLRLLLVRVVFGEALGRYAAGDPTWGEPGALALHLWTQELPTNLALIVRGWSEDLLDFVLLAGDVIGLGLVWGLLLPRRLRNLAILSIVLWQVVTFALFRLGTWPLAVGALASLAVDDQTWRRVLPNVVSRRISTPVWRAVPAVAQYLRGAVAVVLVLCTAYVTLRYFTKAPVTDLQLTLRSWQICNVYDPHPSVTLRRVAVAIEATDDGARWELLEPKSAPLDPFEAPPWPGLHLRRLDWKLDDVALRFASGGSPPEWFGLMLERLLGGSRGVRGLFEAGAFMESPPLAVRVLLHELRPASAAERSEHGRWWYQLPGVVVGAPMMLENGQLVPARF